MDRDVIEALLAIIRPLRYASKNSFANLPKVRDLDNLIPSLAEKILPHLDAVRQQSLKKLTEDFRGFNSLESGEKREMILETLRILDDVLKYQESSRASVPQGEKKGHFSVPSVNSVVRNLSVDLSISRKAMETPVQYIKGVGPKIASLLKRKGVVTVEDALYLFPHRYEDRRNLRMIAELRRGEHQQTIGDVLLAGETGIGRRGKKIFEVVIGDGSGTLALKWFNYNRGYMKTLFKEGERLLASGEVRSFGGAREMIHPETERIERGEDELESFRRILPVYPLTEGLGQKVMRGIMERVVAGFADAVADGIPADIAGKRGLISITDAVRAVHFPPNDSDFANLTEKRSEGHRRLVYDEFFFLEMGIAMRRHGLEVENGVALNWKGELKSGLLRTLPFDLTSAQKRVIADIEKDLSAAHPMHRLLQGDVGCGKTIVALIAALNAVEGGCQAAIMAPTEILAEQHYINIHRFTGELELKTELIKGNLKGKEKSDVVERIGSGEIDIVIGTHAIIQEGVSFKRLGLGIIDEQHRFGVVQRARLKAMGPEDITPNILVMTATPIPRSLAMTVYGDLELSVIDELPPGRQKIETKVYHESQREKVYNLIRGDLLKGRQAYIVYPLVEESEKMELMDATRMADELRGVFKEFKVGLIHGRMKVEEKEGVMSDFKEGKVDILVSTTVIEVGIDVPNATVMVVEHAERFGLSQLHQLRGRVGRGSESSICILLAQYGKSDEARERLRVMEECSSGFDISEADLRLRGPGDFLGTRQSGLPDFRIGNILKDERILKEAREDAFGIIDGDPELKLPEHRLMKDVLKERWKGRLELAGVG